MRLQVQQWVVVAALALTASWPASAHEAAMDADGCHGRELNGVDHCHVDSVALVEPASSEVNLADARRGARQLELPGCMTCADIAALQSKLASLGHSPGPIDGIIGPLTRAAIRSYQQAEGLPVDGLASEALLENLLGG